MVECQLERLFMRVLAFAHHGREPRYFLAFAHHGREPLQRLFMRSKLALAHEFRLSGMHVFSLALINESDKPFLSAFLVATLPKIQPTGFFELFFRSPICRITNSVHPGGSI